MLDLDAATVEYLERNPRAQAQLSLLARVMAQLGLIGSTRQTCPTCRAVDSLTINYRGAGHATCGGCGARATLAELMQDPTDQAEATARVMRTRPRGR